MEFKFSIGQFVTTGESRAAYDWCESQMPIAFTIIERRLVECSGGAQIGYLCRYYAAQGYTEHWFNEIELVEHPNLKQ